MRINGAVFKLAQFPSDDVEPGNLHVNLGLHRDEEKRVGGALRMGPWEDSCI